MNKRSTYEVGYRKPPKQSQFKRGESGNPKGRPKDTRNLKTELEEELKQRVVVREGGNALRVSKRRGLLKSLCNKALQGDPRAMRILLELIMRFEDDKAADVFEAILSEDERKIIETFERRIRQQQPTEDTSHGE